MNPLRRCVAAIVGAVTALLAGVAVFVGRITAKIARLVQMYAVAAPLYAYGEGSPWTRTGVDWIVEASAMPLPTKEAEPQHQTV